MADPLAAAYSLVGRFQYHFARIEQKIDPSVDIKTEPLRQVNEMPAVE